MNTVFFPRALGAFLRPSLTSLLAAACLLLPAALRAQGVDAAINQSVWKMLYGVSDAQMNNPAWLAADDDGDGITNGAELAAGTNPFSVGSTMAVSSTVMNAGGTLALSFPTVPGKAYSLQTSAALDGSSPWTALSPALQITGDGTTQTLTAPAPNGPAFYRVVVQDIDTDGDGVSDWAEKATGFDPMNAHSHGAAQDDHTALTADLANENVVTLTATEPAATQPPDAVTAATDTGAITITRGGTLHFSTITVPLSWSGTALAGVDYAAMPSTVTFPPKVGVITLTFTPLANAARRNAVTATVSALPGAGYNTSAANAASILISPAGNPTGTGLTGYYYVSSAAQLGAPYDPAKLFAAANLKTTRLDPAVNFTWTGLPPTPDFYTTGGSNQAAITTNYTVRWVGQVQPQYSETYYFDTKTDDGVKLWVNNQQVPLIDGWSYQLADRAASIDLKAGVLYDIRMEYYQGTSSALAQLYWYSASQPRQIIPTARLYPATVPVAPPSITGPGTAVGFVGQPFSTTLVVSGSGGTALTFALGAQSAALPPGLSLNPATGVISGTPTAVGIYQVALTATNTSGTGGGVLEFQILNAGSGVTREIWLGLTGPAISDLPLASAPASTDNTLVTPEDNTSYPARTGERLRGYFTAPITGNYYFWIAANNAAELWISDDTEPVNLSRRAWVTAPGTGVQAWNDPNQAHQRSPWLSLVAGQRYYYEVLHNTGDAASSGNVAVGGVLDPTGKAATPVVAGTNPTGVTPGYLLSRYDYPPTVAAQGALYVTNLSPQGVAVSSAVGTANMRVSPDNTQAILHFAYGGLSSPRTAYHIHMGADAAGSGPIVFDLDDADRFHPELRTADGGYIWNIVDVGSITSAQIVTAIKQGFTYFNVHTVNFPGGEIRGNLGLVQGSQNPPALTADPGFTDDSGTDAGAARFLNQAAYGAGPADLAAVKAGGYSAWIDNQIALPATHLYPDVQAHIYPDPTNPYPGRLMQNAWWRAAVTAPDQLRQRTAFAWSEILVTSLSNASLANHAEAMSTYYDVLADGAFGNFRDLLKAVTLNPTMGFFLNMQGNPKGDITTGLHPNENYAREIMQLFSIGLNRLWPDGTLVLDSQGNLVPTYGQDEITGMARVFTGWTWNQTAAAGTQPTNFSPTANWLAPMTLVPKYHELGAKVFLNNVVRPAADGYNFPAANTTGSQADPSTALCAAYCQADLDAAIDSIFNHPNVGPYICRQLIQRLVTSNPSPAYLYRVVAKFNDDGSAAHLRGNLAATVRAILLDGEARNVAAGSNTSGKQREHLLRIAAPARTFPYTSATGSYTQAAGSPIINVTLAAGSPVNRLASGDGVLLDFSANATGSPAVAPWNNPTTGSYTVLSTPAPTSSTFAVTALGFSNVGYTPTAATTVTPSTNLTVKVGGPVPRVVNGTMLYGEVYLQFQPGGTGPDGIYRVGDPATGTNYLQVFTPTVPTNPAGATVFVPKIGCTYAITNPNGATGASTMTFTTLLNHNFQPGDRLWLDVSAGSQAQIAPQEFTVAAVLDSVTFTVNNTVHFNNETKNGLSMYPLVAPSWGRSGSVAQAASKFDVGSTDGLLIQSPMNSPTVFNFFYPDYKHPGALAAANVTTPEFELTTDTNLITLTNTINQVFLASTNNSGLCTFASGGILFDLSPYMTAPYSVADVPGVTALVNKLGDLLTGGQLTPAAKNQIINYVTGSTGTKLNFPTTSTRDRVRAIVQQIVISPEYAIQR